jgi:hypothetical protein
MEVPPEEARVVLHVEGFRSASTDGDAAIDTVAILRVVD